MEANVTIDETSCGPFCQHPYCWYSNRRVERGLPLKREVTDDTTGSTDGELPTLKVLNLLDEYGYDPGDQYPTRQPMPRKMQSKDDAEHPIRSLSAPSARNGNEHSQTIINISPQKVMPPTPHQTPINSRQGPQRGGLPSPQGVGHRSAPSSPSHQAYQGLGQRVSRVDMREALDFGSVKHQGVIPSGKIYVWCPTKDGKVAQDTKPTETKTKVHPKDVTADLLPESMASQHKTSKVKKKQPNHQTPTGGRPYTHPARSPPPSTRRTLPQDFDEGIAQLLQLPREVLLDILERTKESDLFDKEKVSLLLEKLLPLIHFHKDEMPQPQPISPINMQLPAPAAVPPAPLHSSGILRQKKVTLLDNTQRRVDPVRAPPPSRSMPFFMDESAMSGITSSTYTRRERPVQTRDEDRETMLPSPTIASEDILKRKPLGPLRGGPTEMSHHSRRKLTSVSAKSLPPLQPGSRPTRPFNYTSQSFDLALSPLSTPDYEASEKPSSPYSGRASTVYVTVPSVLSDHTPPVSPASMERTPVPPITRQSSAHYSNMSSTASEDFNAIHGATPHAPPQVFRVPYGTETVVRGGSMQREDLTQSSTRYIRHVDIPASTAYDSPSAPPSMPPTTCPPTADIDQERPINTATTDTRDTSELATPMKRPDSTSQYDASTSVMAQASDKAAGSPMPLVTPLPSTASPEVWPVVDERDYLQSPERKMERLSNKKIEMIQAPVAPPPSPEPTAMDVDYDIHDMANKSTAGSSLTPLAEEEEEEEEEEGVVSQGAAAGQVDAEQESSRETEVDRTGTRSRGYLADDADGGSHPTEESRLNTADSDVVKQSVEGTAVEGDLPAVQEEKAVTKEPVTQKEKEEMEDPGVDKVEGSARDSQQTQGYV